MITLQRIQEGTNEVETIEIQETNEHGLKRLKEMGWEVKQ